MTDLSSRIAALTPDERARLEARLAGPARDGSAVGAIRPRDRSRPTPLGVSQQREWAIERLRGANNIPGAFQVSGTVDLDLLARVLVELVRRHEVLRSTVEIGDDGVPVQVVHMVRTVPVPVVDLTQDQPEHRHRRVAGLCREEIVRPFDPASPLRLRLSLLRLAADEHVALFVTDHAACDAWSLAILMADVAALYAAAVGLAPQPPPPALQFGDFAAWQREQFDPAHVDAEVAYWRRTLEGIPAPPVLPADRPFAARVTYDGDVHVQQVPADVMADVRAFCESTRASLFPLLLAASAVLVHRHLDQGDLVIGSLVSGRTRTGTERLIGCFANPLPLRVRVAEDRTLREAVVHARDTLATALEHQDVPFDRLVGELGLGRESAQTSLSPLWINVLTVPPLLLELPGLTFAPVPFGLGLASVDLTISALPDGDELQLQWHYMTELFDRGTVALLAEQFLAVLGQVVRCPDIAVADVELA